MRPRTMVLVLLASAFLMSGLGLALSGLVSLASVINVTHIRDPRHGFPGGDPTTPPRNHDVKHFSRKV